MAEESNREQQPYVHLEAGLPIFTPSLEDPDPKKRADREADKSYKDEQLALQRKIFWTQVGLAVFGLFGIGIGLLQTNVAQQSADNSQKSILLAQKTEREARLMNEKQLADSERQFKETLKQMRGQTGAQKDSASASQAAAQAMSGQVDAANKANTISQTALEAQTRPWIGIDDEGPQNVVVGENGTVSFDLPLRNYGHSPAIVVRTSNAFEIARLGKQEFRYWEQSIGKNLCDFERLPGTTRKDRIPRLTLPIFPNTDKPVLLHVWAERQDTTSPIPASDDLSGCIVYNVKPDSSYITRLIYRIDYSNGNLSFVRMDAQ